MRLIHVIAIGITVGIAIQCTPTEPSVVLLWNVDAPYCEPRRPISEPKEPLENGKVVGNEYRVSYIRPDDILYATFVLVGPNTYALCEWDTSDN